MKIYVAVDPSHDGLIKDRTKPKQWELVDAELVDLQLGFSTEEQFAVHQMLAKHAWQDGFVVTHVGTGFNFAEAWDTREEAIEAACKTILDHGWAKFERIIASLREWGYAPPDVPAESSEE